MNLFEDSPSLILGLGGGKKNVLQLLQQLENCWSILKCHSSVLPTFLKNYLYSVVFQDFFSGYKIREQWERVKEDRVYN